MAQQVDEERERISGNDGRDTSGRLAVRGLLSGLAAGWCCFAGAVTVGLGLGGVNFFATLMQRYQLLFVATSVLLMGLWYRSAIRAARCSGRGRREVARALTRPALVMGATWLVTLAVAMLAARVAGIG